MAVSPTLCQDWFFYDHQTEFIFLIFQSTFLTNAGKFNEVKDMQVEEITVAQIE